MTTKPERTAREILDKFLCGEGKEAPHWVDDYDKAIDPAHIFSRSRFIKKF